MHPVPSARQRDLVLVGGGHAHVQVLARFAMEPPPGVRLTVVVDTPVAVYSGMVPGFVAGQYRLEELEIDVLPLARRAGARFVVARCMGVDAATRRLQLEGRAPLPYDVASFDVGSTVAGLERAGVREHALATRPIGRFVHRLEERLAALGPEPRLLVVGGGAAGVEVAFALEARLRERRARVTLVEQDETVLRASPRSLRWRVLAAATRRGIEVRVGARVGRIDRDAALLTDGERLPCDLVLWVAGAGAQTLFRDSGLPTDARGFVRVRPTLQVEGHDELFACGDCASLIAHPETPKAGVYAVRQGPVLTEGLLSWLAGRRPRPYTPQRDFLALLTLGDGTALGSKWGASFGGRWVMRWKDRIDRRFVERYQVLDGAGAAGGGASPPPAMAPMTAPCGGCASKLGQHALERALARLGAPAAPGAVLGLAQADDAAAWLTVGGERVVASLDAFRAFTDDPWLVGEVAAVNAVSDLYAKGVAPRYALAIVTLPDAVELEEQEELLFQVLSGARAALEPLGAALLGGHSTTGPELAVGFAVHGAAAPGRRLMLRSALAPGERLVLTKALGTGVLFRADMMARSRGPWFEAAVASMRRPNRAAAAVAAAAGARAATDVSGFGLAGHLAELVRASEVSARLDVASLPALPGALELLAAGLRSTFHAENERLAQGLAVSTAAAGHQRTPLLFDPQTSGGLLFGVAPDLAAAAVADLHAAGDADAAVIGEVTPARGDGALFEIAA